MAFTFTMSFYQAAYPRSSTGWGLERSTSQLAVRQLLEYSRSRKARPPRARRFSWQPRRSCSAQPIITTRLQSPFRHWPQFQRTLSLKSAYLITQLTTWPARAQTAFFLNTTAQSMELLGSV